jgi:predicted RNA polymerase sigma factor
MLSGGAAAGLTGLPSPSSMTRCSAYRRRSAHELDTQRRLGEANGPGAGLAVLDGIDPDEVSTYQPYWAVRGHLLQRLGRTSEAVDAFDRAIGLAEEPAVREFLLHRRG